MDNQKQKKQDSSQRKKIFKLSKTNTKSYYRSKEKILNLERKVRFLESKTEYITQQTTRKWVKLNNIITITYDTLNIYHCQTLLSTGKEGISLAGPLHFRYFTPKSDDLLDEFIKLCDSKKLNVVTTSCDDVRCIYFIEAHKDHLVSTIQEDIISSDRSSFSLRPQEYFQLYKLDNLNVLVLDPKTTEKYFKIKTLYLQELGY